LIDLHSHILPGIDDGAVDIADSIGMARQAHDDDIELVCATPHIRADHDVRIGELPSRVEALNAELARAGVATRVITGGEVAEAVAGHLSDEELDAVSLGGAGTWILLEPAPGPLGESFIETVDGLAERGHRTLVAHPERHFDDQSFETLAAVTQRGGLVQVTAETFAESSDGWAPFELARRGLLHVLASDSHSSRYGRPLRLSAGAARLHDIAELRPYAGWILDTAPRAIVAGHPVAPPFSPA
jgi:protein-tyrosine phosphatase